jgi:RNA polymerase sigma-70 factor (ECF subfamily)
MAVSNGGGLSDERVEREEFSFLYRRHADELYRFCLRRTGNPAAAEEVLATVFLESWRRRHELDFRSKPARPWLYAVARNVLRNQWRDQRRQEAAIRTLEYVQRRYADDPSEELARQQTARVLVGSLEALPREQREVVGLCMFGGRSYAAAALDLKVPIGTVRSRLARARLNLAHAVRTASGA